MVIYDGSSFEISFHSLICQVVMKSIRKTQKGVMKRKAPTNIIMIHLTFKHVVLGSQSNDIVNGANVQVANPGPNGDDWFRIAR